MKWNGLSLLPFVFFVSSCETKGADSQVQNGAGASNNGLSAPAELNLDGKSTIVFSPAWPMMNDYDALGDLNQQSNWDSIAAGYDFFNYHMATFSYKWHTLGNQTHYDNILLRMKQTANIVVEGQSVVGLQHLAGDRGVSIATVAPACANTYNLSNATMCGIYAADAMYYDAAGANGTWWGLNRMKRNSGPTVKALLLDSFFWDAAANFGWDSSLSVSQTKSMVQYYMAGFIDRMRQADHLGPSLQIWAISHFKYELVNGNSGINAGCYNTCRRTGSLANSWLQEDIMFDFILPALSGRVNAVIFDHSWSAFSVSQNGCTKWKRMNSIIKSKSTPAGEFLIGADYLWGQSPHEGWVGGPVAPDATNNQTAFSYRIAQLDTIQNRYPHCTDANFDNHRVLIVGTWHKYPSHTFSPTGEADLSRALRCVAHRTGKAPNYNCE